MWHDRGSVVGRKWGFAVLLPLLVIDPHPTFGTENTIYHPDTDTWWVLGTTDHAIGVKPAGGASAGAASDMRDDWNFSENVGLFDDDHQQLWPDIAVAPDGRIAIMWMDQREGQYHIYYSESNDGGLTWSESERVDDRQTGTQSKFVDFDFTPSGIPVAVWEDDRWDLLMSVQLSKRDPAGGGTPWTPNIRVNDYGPPPSSSDFMNPSIAVYDDDTYFVAWTDWREGVFNQVYCRGTYNGGASWGPETRISDEIGYEPVAADPCLICDRDSHPYTITLYCVTNDWRGDVPGGRFPNVYSYRSHNGGVTWSVGVQVNDIEPRYQWVTSHSLVLLEDGTLTAGWWNDTGSGPTYYDVSISTDEGVTWSPRVDVNESWATGIGVTNSIAAWGNNVYAVMAVYVANWDLYFRASNDGGRTWPDPMVRVDDDATGAAIGCPVVAASSADVVHAAWQDNRGAYPNWKTYAATGTRQSTGVADPGVGGPALGLRVIPNPFQGGGSATIYWPAGQHEARTLNIYDTAGRCLRTLRGDAGVLAWDGRDRTGRLVPAGKYWLRAMDGGQGATWSLIRFP